MVIKTNIGRFFIRKNTIDFKLANSAYELRVIKRFKSLLPSHDLFIDIGANIGTYSLIAAREGKRCMAFEPIPANFHSLKKNIELNGYKELIQVFEFGLSNEKEKTKFNFDPLKPGASSIHPHKRMGKTITVQLEEFDKLEIPELSKAEKVLIKIDIEGMELNALKGMKTTLTAKNNICLIIESKHSGTKNLINLLNDYGKFKYESIDEFNILAIK